MPPLTPNDLAILGVVFTFLGFLTGLFTLIATVYFGFRAKQ